MLPQLTLPSKPPPVWTTNPSHNKDDHHSIPTPLEHSFPPSSATSTRFDLASSSTNSSHLFRQESLAKKPDGTQSAGLPTLASSNPISPPDLIKPFPLDHNVHLDQPLRPNYTSADAAPPLISPTATDPSPDTPLHIGFSSAPTTNGEIGERGRHQQPLHFTHDPSRRSDGPEAQEQADATSIFGTAPVGLIGKTKPRAVVRIERDYSARGATSGRVQFWDGWVAELEGRITPLQLQNTLNDLNSILASAYDPYRSILDNTLSVLTFYILPLFLQTHYEKEMKSFEDMLVTVNQSIFNPAGLNILHPRKVAFLFLEIEYY